MEDLANLSYKLRDYDLCKKQASLLLSVNKNNEKGMLILASATLQLGDKSEATKLYKELLERFPNNYDALSKFIQLTYMCGRLEDVLEVCFMLYFREALKCRVCCCVEMLQELVLMYLWKFILNY